MKRIKKFILDWIWQFPQNLLGLIWKSQLENSEIIYTSNIDNYLRFYLLKEGPTVILGKYLFTSQDYKDKKKLINKAKVNSKLSSILGPVYLIYLGFKTIKLLVSSQLRGRR